MPSFFQGQENKETMHHAFLPSIDVLGHDPQDHQSINSSSQQERDQSIDNHSQTKDCIKSS